MPRSRAAALLLAAAAALATAGCGAGGDDPAAGAALRVVATTPVVADFARNVGGDRVAVTQILKPGVDPHDYEPSPGRPAGDRRRRPGGAKTASAWRPGSTDTVQRGRLRGTVVDSSQGRRPSARATARRSRPRATRTSGTTRATPRRWCRASPPRWSPRTPPARPTYEAGTRRTTRRSWTRWTGEPRPRSPRSRRRSASWSPTTTRSATTCARYGLSFVGSVIPSFDTSAELSGRQLSDLVAKIRSTGVEGGLRRGVAAAEERRDGRHARPASRWSAARTRCTGTASARPGTPGGTYLGAERHNTDTIVRALGGRV